MIRPTILAAAVISLVAARSAAAGPVETGQQVFAAQKCSICHSVAGKGNPKGPLDGVAKKYNAAELREWLVNAKVMAEKHKAIRKPPMKDFSSLPAADVDALVAYLQTLK